MIKSKTIYSPQNFLEAVTGNCYLLHYKNVREEIQEILKANNKPYKCVPFIKIGTMLETLSSAVLVDTSEDASSKEYFWFEVTEDFKD